MRCRTDFPYGKRAAREEDRQEERCTSLGGWINPGLLIEATETIGEIASGRMEVFDLVVRGFSLIAGSLLGLNM